MSKLFEAVSKVVSVDRETGELIEENISTTIVKKVEREDFIQVYLKDMSALLDIKAVSEMKVLLVLWRIASFNKENDNNGNKIVLVKAIKEEIAKELDISVGTIDNVLRKLVDRELIIKVARSVYKLNPNYFFKGYLKDRLKVVKTIIEYQIEDTK